ncbi:MAG: Lsr2 family protein [Mycobacteriales bacterium]
MAQRTLTLLVCDLCGDGKEGEATVEFSIDGRSYEIDVCAEHNTEIHNAFAAYVGAARRSGSGLRRGRRGRGGGDRERVAEIRAWARQQGLHVSERGRIAATIAEKYEAAHR